MLESRLFRWLLILVPTALAIAAIMPPQHRLKGGIDLVGGTSLLFEIDTAGLTSEERRGLSEKVMDILKSRVDPGSQMNLVWRPIGNNKLEIQMPRPSHDARQRREEYEKARAAVRAMNLTRVEIESALNVPEDQRRQRLSELERGVPERSALFDALLAAHTSYLTAKAGDDAPAIESSRKAYEDALERALNSSLSLSQLGEVVALPDQNTRTAELEKIKARWPAYAARIDDLVARYDEWSTKKGALEDPSDLKRRIRGAGVLEFRILADRDMSNPGMIAHSQSNLREPIAKYVEQLQTRGPRSRPGDKYIWLPIKDAKDFLNLKRESQRTLENFEQYKDSYPQIVEKYAGKYYVLTHADREHGLLRPSESGVRWKLNGAFPSRDARSGKPNVVFALDPRGGAVFGKLTSENIGRQLMIVLDGEAMSHATIQSKITERGEISGDFTREDVADLVTTLEAGSLPARLKETPLAEKEIGPSLGETNRRHGMQAAMVALLVVGVFMVIYYRVAGSVAVLALFLNLLFTLALMALLQATFTLPGIAGLILTIGMAVDANVLIFERMREERGRGQPLRKAIKLGYDRAFSSIFDSNLTTLITCFILYALGSEEIKGFAMTLGFGLATSMFTALFVTRQVFDLLTKKNVIKDLKMMKFFAKPNIDWVGKRKVFLAVSTVLVGLSLLSFGIETAVDKQGIYDIDFLGGTSVLVELRPDVKMNDEEVRKAVSAAGSAGQRTAVRFLNDAAAALEKSEVKPGSVSQQFIVSAAGLDGNEVATLVRAAQEDVLARGGVTVSGKSVTFDLKPERNLDLEGFKTVLHNSAAYARKAAERLASARVQSVKDIGEEAKTHDAYEIITVETNRELVQTAVVAALADKLSIEQAISFHLVTDPDRAPEGLFPIQEDDVYLGDVLGREANFDIRHFKGGVALVLDDLSPPQTVEKIDARLRNARLQPEFQGTEWRDYQIIGLVPAKTPEGEDGYRQIALVSVDERLPYYDDPTAWETRLAKPELAQARFAFAQEKALRKVIQFAPQVASQTQTQAFVAMFLAWVAIVAYLWIRFGTIQWGLAAIVALVHDVAIALGCVVLSHFVYNTIVGQALLLSDFKIDLPVVAALLTIIGFSVNDTIVIFDRVRENRGKLGALSASMINNSLNQTLSRTILTTLTAFVTVLIMYIWGGEGARGFSFVMMCGMISGTYSTVGIALPLLYRPVLLNVISAVIAALGLLGAVMLSGVGLYGQIVGGVIIAIALAATIVLMTRGRRTPRERGAPLPAAA